MEEIKQHTNSNDDNKIDRLLYSGSGGENHTETKTENLRRSLLKREAQEHYFGSLLEVRGYN